MSNEMTGQNSNEALRAIIEREVRYITGGCADLKSGDESLVERLTAALATPAAVGRIADGMLPDVLVPHAKEWYRLCDRRFGVYRITISGELAEAIVEAVYLTPRPEAPPEPIRAQGDTEPKCSTHPHAPHGFNRNASQSEGRYVCDCEGWKPDDAARTAAEQESARPSATQGDGETNG